MKKKKSNLVWTNGNEANETFTEISSEAGAVLRENYLKSTKFEVRQCNTIFSEVIEERETYIINIQEKICTCRRFQEDEVLCSHALAVIEQVTMVTILHKVVMICYILYFRKY
ncbi:hypothetical protein G4B88_030615 [Cannabis sativa]|uniref:SWIM-type domain-containing protein n=1 Tax=Cannabis sativa TaxID=3483 RepID=A0A7J6H6M5_CANSA|nr:hypothetical protein G4B88_030615 [Cannabis sativa]